MHDVYLIIALFRQDKILQMPELKLFALRDKFSRIAHILLKLANIEHNWKIKNLIILLKISFVRLLAGEVGKLAHLWHVDRTSWIISTSLADWQIYWHVKMRSWNALGTLAREHVDYAVTHDLYNTWFSKFPYTLWKCIYYHQNHN